MTIDTVTPSPLKKQHIIALNAIMGIYTLKVLWEFIEHFINEIKLSIWCFGEFLINYQGGFVRRGLLGEIIYLCATHLGVSPRLFVGVFCAICVAVVVWFFIKQFRDNKICWWLLPLNFCLANMDVIRKDFFFVVSLISILYCYKSHLRPLIKIVIINLVAVFTILTHEVFFFYCIPLLCWVIIKDNIISKHLFAKICACLPMVLSMFLTSLFHGDTATSMSIANSWAGILNINPSGLIDPVSVENVFLHGGAIGALSWSTIDAIKFHFDINFVYTSLRIPGFILRPVMLVIIFYFLLNYLATFSILPEKRRLLFTRILIIQFFSLLPMFTVLSCDTSRVYFYWVTSTFVFFFLLNENVEKTIIPVWYSKHTQSIHNLFTERLKPPIWLMIALLFTISVPYGGNNLIYQCENNIIMQIIRLFIVGLKTIL